MFYSELIDLHVHSNVSDGTLSPEDIAHHAKESGLSAIALTDHDTIDGVSRCIAVGNEIGLTVISGVELSASYLGNEIHLLGYDLDYTNSLLQETLIGVVNEREERNLTMLKKLQSLGFDMQYSDLSQGVKNEIITRAHFARALLTKGYIQTTNEAFDLYIGAGCEAYVEKKGLTHIACIDLIHQAGGKAVLAHPGIYKFAKDNTKILIKELKNCGLDGVEVIYPKHSPEYIATLTRFCKEEGLAITGGSDFHGENKSDIKIGKGLGHTEVPISLLDKLLQR